MNSILTPDEKKYLRATSRYIKSLGQDTVALEFDISDFGDISNVEWNNFDTFSNNYAVEIPTKIKEIFDKVLKYVDSKGFVDSMEDEVDVNYEIIEISIDADDEVLKIKHYYSYYTDGPEQFTEWTKEDAEDDESLRDVFDTLHNDIKNEKLENGELILNYNGSGDSGYIEDFFEGNIAVPANIEDWCYRQLENQYGRWEINEGSRGYFTFDLNKNRVTLVHIQVDEENKNEQIFQESFKK